MCGSDNWTFDYKWYFLLSVRANKSIDDCTGDITGYIIGDFTGDFTGYFTGDFTYISQDILHMHYMIF